MWATTTTSAITWPDHQQGHQCDGGKADRHYSEHFPVKHHHKFVNCDGLQRLHCSSLTIRTKISSRGSVATSKRRTSISRSASARNTALLEEPSDITSSWYVPWLLIFLDTGQVFQEAGGLHEDRALAEAATHLLQRAVEHHTALIDHQHPVA